MISRRVADVRRVVRDVLAFHQERVSLDGRAVAHRHAVVDEGFHAHRAAVAEDNPAGFEGSVFQGMALDERSLVECAVITDGHECFFYYAGAGVVEPLADFDAQHSPEHRLKRCSSQGRTGQQCPEPFVLPEISQPAHVGPDRAVDRHHHLGTEQAVLPHVGSDREVDVVPEDVAAGDAAT
ncbi:hypothetical protein J2W14_001074 [Pseudarthrobacter oxydans]|nr:hypothetical protein [Pseudarthrobacter oxydans]